MIRDIPDDTDDTFWWEELNRLFDSYDESDNQPTGRRRGTSTNYCSLSELEDVQDFGVSTWDRKEKYTALQQDFSSLANDSLVMEIKGAVVGLPAEEAFKKLFWEILEFEPVDLPVSRRLTDAIPRDFDTPVISAESDSLKVITVTLHSENGLSEDRAAVISLANEVGKEYETALLVVGSASQPGQALLVLCSRETNSRIYPIYDQNSAVEVARILAETASQVTDIGGFAAFAYLDEAFSEEQRDLHFRKWVSEQRELSDWWIWHQYSKTKVLSNQKQIELLKMLAELWPFEVRNTSLVPSESKARRLYDILFVRNMRMAAWMSHRYKFRIGRGLDFEDLYQEGLHGLMRAIRMFNPFRGIQFSTYAVWWVRQAVTRAIANYERTVRIPVHMIERISRIVAAAREIRRGNGHEPDVFEIAEHLEVPVGWVLRGLEAATEIISIEALTEHEEGFCLLEAIADGAALSAVEHVAEYELRTHVSEALASLTPREELVIRLRFGIGSHTEHTLESVGQLLSVTRERIRQIEAKALRRLRYDNRSRKLRPFSIGGAGSSSVN